MPGIAGLDVAGRLDGSATIRDGEAIGRLVSDELRFGALRAPLAVEFVGSVAAGTLDARLDYAGIAANVGQALWDETQAALAALRK